MRTSLDHDPTQAHHSIYTTYPNHNGNDASRVDAYYTIIPTLLWHLLALHNLAAGSSSLSSTTEQKKSVLTSSSADVSLGIRQLNSASILVEESETQASENSTPLDG